MATLAGNSIASSYTSLLKLDGNTDSTADGDGSNAIQVKTGDNDATPLFLNTDRLGIGGQPSYELDINLGSGTAQARINTGANAKTSLIFKNSIQEWEIGNSVGDNNKFTIRDITDSRNAFVIDGGGDATFSNNVGIGTTSPEEKIHSTGAIVSTGVNATGATAGTERAFIDLVSNKARIGHFRGTTSAGSGGLQFYTDSVERARIDASGSLGIGTASPSVKLQIEESNNGADVQFNMRALNDGGAGRTTAIKFDPDARKMHFGEDFTNLVLDTSNVRVGIGTSSPLATFHAKMASDVNFTTTANSSSLRLNAVNDAVDATIPLEINSTSTQFLSNVGIGTSSPVAKIDILGDRAINITNTIADDTNKNAVITHSHYDSGTRTQGFTMMQGYSSSTTNRIDIGGGTSQHYATKEIKFHTASNTTTFTGTERMVITSDGNILPGADDAQDLGSSSLRFDDIHATNGTIQTSDERLKDNIADSSLGLDFVNALRPVKYKWKDYSYDVKKEEAVEAKEAIYETVVIQEAVEAKEAVMGTRQKTVSKEVENKKTEIVEEDGKYVKKEITYTETIEEPQYEEVNLYDEDGNKIQRLVSEAIEAVEGVEYQEATYYKDDD
jgi:hypothetical protein